MIDEHARDWKEAGNSGASFWYNPNAAQYLSDAKTTTSNLRSEALRLHNLLRDVIIERDNFRAALDRIVHIGPLGVDTYPEVYRRMREIALAALGREENP
jgi:predicted nucleic acid-binding protein